METLRKIYSWYFTRSSLPYWLILILDCFLVFFAGIITYWMFNNAMMALEHFSSLAKTLSVYVLLSIVGFRLFRTYSGVIRYSSFVDLQKVAYANLVNMLLCILVHYPMITSEPFMSFFEHMSTRCIAVIFLIATMLMWMVRILVKLIYDVTTADHQTKRALIYGVQEGGVGLAKNIRTQRPAKFILKGFISHDTQYLHHMLMGVKVYDMGDELKKLIASQKIDAVLISPMRNDDFRHDTEMQDLLINADVKIYMMEGVKEWNGEEDYSSNQMREVSVEDLLPRQQIKVDMLSIGRQLAGKRILITGSAGSIGSEIVRQVAPYKPEAMVLIDQAETPQHDIRLMMSKQWPDIPCETIVTSICKKDRMEMIFSSFRPDYVFHAAAYKHVPMMENNPSESVQNNIYGTKVIADLSVKYGVKKFVMVSTDKAVNPTNVMGCSKRICEIYVQSLNAHINKGETGQTTKTQFVTTRFGNVLGSNGSVIPLFQEQIKKGGPVTVTDPNIIRYFMLIPEACKLVLEAGTKGCGGQIFVFDMGKPVKIADLAQRMINMSGAKGVEIKYTGLRAGEKLFEEVLSEQENTLPSFHEKIRIANVREYDFDTVAKDIDELIEISRKYDDMATVKKMKEIVPEFKSNNSIYTTLDK